MRAVIAEDSVLLRAGLVKVLEAVGYEVVAAVGEAEQLLAAVAEHHPDVVVTDVRMPPGYTDEGVSGRRPPCCCCRSTSRSAMPQTC